MINYILIDSSPLIAELWDVRLAGNDEVLHGTYAL
jgi:hypothetical protein